MKIAFDDVIKAHVFFMECDQLHKEQNVAIVEADDGKAYILDAHGLKEFDQTITYLKLGANSDLRVAVGLIGHEPRT